MRLRRLCTPIRFLGLYASLCCIIHPSAARISLQWLTPNVLAKPAELQGQLLGTDVYVRADSVTTTSNGIVNNKPTDDDSGLTWDHAVGKGNDIIKLLDTEYLSRCDVVQSNFSKWESLAQYGWSKLYQGLPMQNTENGTDWRHTAEKLGLSTDDQKNIQYIFGQLANVTVDGKSYQCSGGSYNNVMNTDGGIIALQSFSPHARGASQDGSAGHELVPLKTWADVTFLEWVDACKGDEKCVQGLTSITKGHAQSNVTIQIANQALGGTERWGAWPGKTFSKDSEQFAALVATPSGRDVAWLLLTHREQLGWKSVASVNLWSGTGQDSASNYYTFHVEDSAVSATLRTRLARSTSSEEPGSEQAVVSNASSIVYDGDSATVNYQELYVSDHDYSYDDAQKIGGYLANLTQSSAEASCVQQSQWKFSDLKSNGWNSSTLKLNNEAVLDTLKTIFSDAKLSVDDENFEHTVWEHATATDINSASYPATNANYDVIYGNHALVLLGVSSPASRSEQNEKELLPPLKALSDVVWLQWADRSKVKNTDIKDLRFVVIYQATNTYTTRIVGQIFNGQTPPKYPGKSFGQDSKELRALLASPHGQGVIWLLSQRKSELGTKIVQSVQIWNEQQPCLLFKISSLETDGSQDTSNEEQAAESQAVRKSLSTRDETWDEQVAKGKRYLDMLRCGTGTPSQFTSIDDLRTWGWREEFNTHPRGKLGGVYDDVVEYLGVSFSPEETWQIEDRHVASTTIDGTTYPPTDATYYEQYAPGFILAMTNYGPRESGPELEPPVRIFPKLEKQSDVMFLEYQRAMERMNKPMTGLKGILRSGVVNSRTRSTVAKALGAASWNSLKMPVWPGVDFDADSDEAAALITSPNGRAPVWLLATHKEQLGHKTISKVKVFGETTDYRKSLYVLFVFKDVNENSGDNEASEVSPDQGKRSAIASRTDPSERRVIQRSPQAPPASAIDSAWAKAVQKGTSFLEMLNCGSGPQSKWTNYDDLEKWGWVKTYDEPVVNPEEDEEYAMDYFELPSSIMTDVRFTHNKNTDHDGKDYPATTARYRSHYASELIVAMANYGPKFETFDDDPVPELQQLSDVWFLAYAEIMRRQNKPLDKLKGVLRYNVVNADTLALIRYAIKTDIPSVHHDAPRWPGKDFNAGGDEFAALLASPNGRGVAWLLLNHKQLGPKTIDKVRIWYDPEELAWMMLFVLKDRAEESGDQTQSAVSVRALGLKPEKYQEILGRGKMLVSALQSTEDCFPQSEFTNYGDLAEWGWVVENDQRGAPMKTQVAKRVLDFLGASWDVNVNRKVTDLHDETKEKNGKTYYRTEARYNNHYNPSLIIAKSNFGPAHWGRYQNPRVTGGANDPFPLLARLSDVLFLEFQRVMTENKQPMNKLKGVWRDSVENSDTRDLAIQIASDNGMLHGIPKWPGVDYSPESDELAALVGSPNGVGVAYLLIQHRQQFGLKTISSVKVWYDMALHILFLVDDMGSQPDNPSPRQRRTPADSDGHLKAVTKHLRPRAASNDAPKLLGLARRLDEPDSEKVNDARNSGRFLVMAQYSSVEVLESCLNIPQSTFTESRQLGESGWTMLSDRPVTLEEDLDAATFNSWLDMNLDLSANSNHKIEYQHLEKTTGSDGTVYYPSGAYYQNLFSEGGIAALNNASPWKTGRNRNPPVDGKARPFPPLKQWSDAVFLAYKDMCKGDPVKMKKLKGCLRHNVVNIKAREVLHEYMDKHGDLDDGKPKAWPGTEYKLDVDDGFNVALGVPNGKGVAFLLATHRESLGWKEIYKIRIFSVDWASSYNILYYIRDHEDGATRRDLSHAPLTISGNTAATRAISLRASDDNQLLDQDKAVGVVLSSGDTARRLRARADVDPFDIYTESLRRGTLLYCKFQSSAADVPQSEWVNYESLGHYGWQASPGEEYQHEYGMVVALQGLNLPVEATANIQHRYEHTLSSRNDGKDYPPTWAMYSNVFNIEGGVIIADVNWGPDHMGFDKEETVPLKQYSDVVFLAWQEEAGAKTKGLKYMFRHNIINTETNQVVNYILDKRQESNVAWPGVRIDMPDEDAKALLGTPNGRGAAWMLIQHKEQFGPKTISAVTIFKIGRSLSLLFWISDSGDGAANREISKASQHLQDPPSNGSGSGVLQTPGGPVKRSVVAPANITTALSPLEASDRLIQSISKRIGDAAKNYWAALRLF